MQQPSPQQQQQQQQQQQPNKDCRYTHEKSPILHVMDIHIHSSDLYKYEKHQV